MANKQVSISKGNRKMSAIPSVSLTPIITCPNCDSCARKCYANKIYKLYQNTRKAWDGNLEILKENRDLYFEQVGAAIGATDFFRFHVSGDIIDKDYFERMCKVARSHKTTKILAFTKNYKDVNDYLNEHRKPSNLQIIFSIPFDGAVIDNPHNLPTARVILKGNEPHKGDKICGGNCTECACQGVGCWELKKGQTIAFYEH